MAKIKIALTIGHGKSTDGTWDPGCTYGALSEAALMLAIGKKVAAILRKSPSLEIITDADTGNDRNMIKSVSVANSKGADYYISLHCDYSGAPAGVYPLYVSAAGKKMAQTLNDTIKSELNMPSRGIAKRSDLFELNYTDMPAVLLETSCVKDPILQKPDKYAPAVAKAICKIAGVSYPGTTAKKTATKAPAPKKATKKTTAKPKTNAQKITASGLKLGREIVKHKFTYSNEGSKTTYKSALKSNKRVNCARYASWALQDAGLLKPGLVFYYYNGFKGSAVSYILKSSKFEKIKPNKATKRVKLKPGDIVCFQHHTMIFRHYYKGAPHWYSFGGSDVKAFKKAGKFYHRRKAGYDNEKIKLIIRAK